MVALCSPCLVVHKGSTELQEYIGYCHNCDKEFANLYHHIPPSELPHNKDSVIERIYVPPGHHSWRLPISSPIVQSTTARILPVIDESRHCDVRMGEDDFILRDRRRITLHMCKYHRAVLYWGVPN